MVVNNAEKDKNDKEAQDCDAATENNAIFNAISKKGANVECIKSEDGKNKKIMQFAITLAKRVQTLSRWN